jgi:hypothetical protein
MALSVMQPVFSVIINGIIIISIVIISKVIISIVIISKVIINIVVQFLNVNHASLLCSLRSRVRIQPRESGKNYWLRLSAYNTPMQENNSLKLPQMCNLHWC